MHELIQPHEWVCVKFPSEQTRIVQIIPNTTLSLGKYGSFPANLLIERPFHVTYEVQEAISGEDFCRLRIVPAAEVHADMLAQPTPPEEGGGSLTPSTQEAGAEAEAEVELEVEAEADNTETTATPDLVVSSSADDNGSGSVEGGGEDVVATNPSISLLDPATGAVLARSDVRTLVSGDERARQLLTTDEIEALKKGGAGAGRDLVTRLMLSHTALDRKTRYSLAKYKLHKYKKYLRRFSVLPLDAVTLAHWLLVEREPARVLEMREEALALVGCWANVHFAETLPISAEARPDDDDEQGVVEKDELEGTQVVGAGGKWLVVDDTGGLLVAAMAERMGILHMTSPTIGTSQLDGEGGEAEKSLQVETVVKGEAANIAQQSGELQEPCDIHAASQSQILTASPPRSEQGGERDVQQQQQQQQQQQADDVQPVSRSEDDNKPSSSLSTASTRRPPQLAPLLPQTNTLTLVHTNTQPNLHCLKYFGFDATKPHFRPPLHPLCNHLHPLSWLQLLDPSSDPLLANRPEHVPPSEIATWKTSRRSNYHRKHRRWARTAQVAAGACAGGFSGLAVATPMDPVSVLRHLLPLLAGGAAVAVYAPTIEPLAQLVDCFSAGRRAAWAASPPEAALGRSAEELDRWEGSDEFPLNPTLLLGASVQTSRARRWQVLPGRTHPLMMGRGGADGYVFTGWKVVPAEGKVEAKGRFKRRKMW